MSAELWWGQQAQQGAERKHIHYLTKHHVCIAVCVSSIPPSSRPMSVWFHARPCDLCIMVLVLRSVYSKLSLYLDNCSHEDSLSFHSGILMCLFNGLAVPEGHHTPHMWWIPTNCPALTMNSRSPHGHRAPSCRILFPWQTYSTHQTERPCSCTQTPNNRMLVLGQKTFGSPFWGRGQCERVVKYFRGFAIG